MYTFKIEINNNNTIDKVIEKLRTESLDKRKNIKEKLIYLQGGRCLICKEKMIDSDGNSTARKITNQIGIVCSKHHDKAKLYTEEEMISILKEHIYNYYNGMCK